MKIRLIITLFKVFLSLSTFAQFIISTESAHAEVKGYAPGHDYIGQSDELKGTVNFSNDSINFLIRLESIQTGNKTRDKHMYKALNINTHPYATFKGTFVNSYSNESGAPQSVEVNGVFSLNGKEQNLLITVTLKPAENGIDFYASWPILISKYGIKRPGILFYKVKDKHQLFIKGTLKQ